MRFREVERIIKKDGWYLVDQTGSHKQYKHPFKPGRVTIPDHRGDLEKGTVRKIFKQAGL